MSLRESSTQLLSNMIREGRGGGQDPMLATRLELMNLREGSLTRMEYMAVSSTSLHQQPVQVVVVMMSSTI
jgi:hypothetical protein